MTFSIEGKQFLRDGKPVKIISGAVHYFRNLPDTWPDIFRKMRALGCNTVETYCAWNLHEPHPGEFDFSGPLDLSAFLDAANDAGLMAIVRPGPYICAEWDFGGLPWWLMNEPGIEIRSMNEAYLRCFDRYLDRLLAVIKPHLVTRGGSVIMLQCENEYGHYGDDREYLTYLRDGFRRRGIDVPLFTSDSPEREKLLDGTIPGCLATVNFGSRVAEHMSILDEMFPDAPKMCMEMWDGWFDAWGCGVHHTTDAEAYAKTVGDMLRVGSVNMYMLIGGTNFGFMSGANHGDTFAPDVTSYDYDALLTECGDVTAKYRAVREVIRQYADEPLPPVPPDREKRRYGTVPLTESAALLPHLEALSKPIPTAVPRPMETFGEGYGYIAYRTTLGRQYRYTKLAVEGLGDRAQIYKNEELLGVFYIDGQTELRFDAEPGDTLTILVENMGRTNFGSKMIRKKGIAGRVLFDGKIHFGWEAFPLPMRDLSALPFAGGEPTSPSAFWRGTLRVDEPADTFLRTDGFRKGFVLLNGFNLGRFWEIGPQKTLYVPKSLLRRGDNEIVVFTSDGRSGDAAVTFTDTPDLG